MSSNMENSKELENQSDILRSQQTHYNKNYNLFPFFLKGDLR